MADITIDPATFTPKGKIITPTERDALAALGLKWCPKCRTVKPLDAFHAVRSTTDGLQTQCRSCRNAQKRERYHTDPEWREARREQARERNRERYHTDPEYREAHLKQTRERYHTDPDWREAHLKQTREWKRKHRVKLRTIRDRVSRALKHFAGRRGWTDRIAERVLKAPDGIQLMYASPTIEDACARYVGDID